MIQSNFNLIIVTRHDLIWKQQIYMWPSLTYDEIIAGSCNSTHSPAIFQKGCFHFMGLCEPRPKQVLARDPSQCVQDIIHMMPGFMFAAFQRAVGNKGCFWNE